ncbi:ATG8-interacting protein 1 [Iris pallida]|uniref:ATG8-interacting protein 1 n=1 Tax=Iris pallida TaxID=29817 RepID=A0AAX6F1K2_IRIPA|nr:ATG8-interacting protein 1 [Iris pallida]
MADNEKDKEVTPSHGADWEVVQLTASTYAAAPNPPEIDPNDVRTGQESSSALFMSDHFVFPPSEHENLPIEPECSEIHSEAEGEDESYIEEEGDGHDTNEERTLVQSDDILQSTDFFDGGRTSSVPDMGYEVGGGLQGMCSVPRPKSTDIIDPSDSSSPKVDSPPKYSKSSEEDKYDGSGIPSEGWWKRHASSLYRYAKEAHPLWSIFVAASLTGIVILGKRWHRDKWHAFELKQLLRVNDERLNRVLGPINRFKDIVVGGHQRSSLTGGGIATR